MSRIASAIILALLAAGCDDDGADEFDVTVQISNQGSEPALIAITARGVFGYTWDDGGAVRPGEVWIRKYGDLSQVNVEIRRESDNAVLLSDSWKLGDLSRNDGKVLITVYP